MNSLHSPSTFDPNGLLDLARQDLSAGELQAAQEKCLRVLGVRQHHPRALGLLGEVLFAQGRNEEAARVFHALTLTEPTVALHWEHFGTVLRATGRPDQAAAAFEKALKLAPPTPGLLYNLGALQMDQGLCAAAYITLRDGSALDPSNGPLRAAYAQCCFDCGRMEEARDALENWRQLKGLNEDFTVLIAELLGMVGAISRDDPAVERLLARPPQRGRAALGVASLMERFHMLEEAKALAERLEPADGPNGAQEAERRVILGVLASRAGRHEEARQHLESALRAEQDFVHRHKALFPLARTYDALGRFPEAFTAADEAHRSRLAFLELTTGSSSVDDSRVWTLTSQSCSAEDVAAWQDSGPATEGSPVFIVGFPRSGTTLLEQVLDAHPLLRSMDERPYLGMAASELSALVGNYPADLAKPAATDLEAIRTRYWERTRKLVQLAPGQRLVDKNPLNMNHLPAIKRLFPRAPIILCVRHPCDVLLSCFFQDFRAPGLARVCRDLPTLASAYARSFAFWYSQAALLQPKTHEVLYEQLTADFANRVNALCAFLELPWDPAMLAPGEHARNKLISTPSYAEVLNPVSTRAVGRWKHYAGYFDETLATLEPWLRRWGYSS